MRTRRPVVAKLVNGNEEDEEVSKASTTLVRDETASFPFGSLEILVMKEEKR